MKTFEVRFKYYQYNSGCADNGYYTGKKTFENIEKARQFKRIVNLAYDASKNNKYDSLSYKVGSEIVGDIAYAGFINSYANIYEIEIIEKQIN